MQVYLLRHGESVDDIEDAFGGIADFPLSENGKKTALELAKKLTSTGITVLHTSPYKRARETATIVRNALGCDLKIVDGLRERNSYGILSGVNKEKAKDLFAHALKDLKGVPGDYYSTELVPGAEPLPEFVGRVKETFTSILASSGEHDVIGIVTHGNVTRAIYEHILNVKGKVGLDLLAITVLNCQLPSIELQRTEGVRLPSNQ